MERKRIVLVASDVGESETAESFRAALDMPEIEVVSIFGNGQKPFPFATEEMEQQIAGCDLVLATMSEFSEPEVQAGLCAVEHNKPLGLIALGSGFTSWQNPDFPDSLCEQVQLLFVIAKHEIKEARKRFPNALIVASGNPRWESFSEPLVPPADVRSKIALADRQTFILVIGDKKITTNLLMFGQTFEALSDLPDRERFSVVCSIHPGHDPLPGFDQTPTDQEIVDFYRTVLEVGTRDRGFTVGVSCRDNPYGIGAPQMVAGADIILGGTSTELIRAAYLRKPAIALLVREAFPPAQLPLEHQGWWKPCDWGVISPVYGLSSYDLSKAIRQMLEPQGHLSQRQSQEDVFPARVMSQAPAMIRAAIGQFSGF